MRTFMSPSMNSPALMFTPGPSPSTRGRGQPIPTRQLARPAAPVSRLSSSLSIPTSTALSVRSSVDQEFGEGSTLWVSSILGDVSPIVDV
jgi:hypothetical protein